MITNIQPTYEVSNSKYRFKIITHNEEEAKQIDSTLTNSIKFIETLLKYKSFNENYRSSNNDVTRCKTSSYIFTKSGELAGINIYTQETHYDNWDFRPPIEYNNKEFITLKDIQSNIILNIIEDIKDSILKLKDIKVKYNNHILNNIFKNWNIESKIKELEEDIKILQYK